jgi:hypothetical protein
MSRYLFNRPGEGRRRRRPRSRAAGCLLWVVLLIVILIVLSVLFGGFQKGTKADGLGGFRGDFRGALCTSCAMAPTVNGPERQVLGHRIVEASVTGR